MSYDNIQLRDVMDRVDALNEAFDEWRQETERDWLCVSDWAWCSDDGKELMSLTALLDECEGLGGDEQYHGDWYPQTLMHDSNFESEMDEMIAGCYDLPALPSFMLITLDYDALRQDYTSVDFDGETYLCR